MSLRYYQQDAVDAAFAYIGGNPGNHPLIVAPTGSGKSHILGGLCDKIINEHDSKVVVLSHVKEILEQDEEKLKAILPSWRVGLYSSGAKRRERRDVTVAGIQSVYQKAHMFKDVRWVIVDEAHTIPKAGEGRYLTFLKGLHEDVVVIGLTATPFRLGTGLLTEGEGKLFDDICYDVDIVQLIKEGYLSPLHTGGTDNQLDMSGIRLQSGDFRGSDMSDQFDKYELTESIVDELCSFKDTYKSWLIFAIDIKHCEHVAEALETRGIACSPVHSKRSAVHNETSLAAYKAGRLQALVSVAKITTGFDDPKTDLIALIRPTKSPVLHVQMIGRGLRVCPESGKTHCRILDFAGNLMRLGPINDVYIHVKGKGGGGEAPIKMCPSCKTHVPAAARKCYICGFDFPIIESPDLTTIASTDEAVVEKPQMHDVQAWHSVSSVAYKEHHGKKGKSLCILYRCGLRTFKKWIAVGRAGGAGKNAEYFWKRHTKFLHHPEYHAPLNVKDALKRATNGELDVPSEIFVTETGRYPEISSYRYPN